MWQTHNCSLHHQYNGSPVTRIEQISIRILNLDITTQFSECRIAIFKLGQIERNKSIKFKQTFVCFFCLHIILFILIVCFLFVYFFQVLRWCDKEIMSTCKCTKGSLAIFFAVFLWLSVVSNLKTMGSIKLTNFRQHKKKRK